MNIKRVLPIEINYRLKNLKDYLKPHTFREIVSKADRNVFFLDAASYNNVGDQAIAYAMSVFIKNVIDKNGHYYEINEQELLKLLKSLKKTINKKDVIVLSGGGNMGDLYPRYEAIRRTVIRNFPNNVIIIFPQTIDYLTDRYGVKELLRSQKVYRRHKNLYICAREEKSYNFMKELYNNVILVPDIVLYLSGRMNFKEVVKEKQVGICLRNDKESLLSNDDKEIIHDVCESIQYSATELTTMISLDDNISSADQREKIFFGKLKEFSECSCIITDRLHGMIFCLLMHIPCIAIDNNNHKVSGVYDLVKEYVEGIRIVSCIKMEELSAIIMESVDCNVKVNIPETIFQPLIDKFMIN